MRGVDQPVPATARTRARRRLHGRPLSHAAGARASAGRARTRAAKAQVSAAGRRAACMRRLMVNLFWAFAHGLFQIFRACAFAPCASLGSSYGFAQQQLTSLAGCSHNGVAFAARERDTVGHAC